MAPGPAVQPANSPSSRATFPRHSSAHAGAAPGTLSARQRNQVYMQSSIMQPSDPDTKAPPQNGMYMVHNGAHSVYSPGRQTVIYEKRVQGKATPAPRLHATPAPSGMAGHGAIGSGGGGGAGADLSAPLNLDQIAEVKGSTAANVAASNGSGHAVASGLAALGSTGAPVWSPRGEYQARSLAWGNNSAKGPSPSPRPRRARSAGPERPGAPTSLQGIGEGPKQRSSPKRNSHFEDNKVQRRSSASSVNSADLRSFSSRQRKRIFMHSKIFDDTDAKASNSVYSARRQEELVEEMEGIIRMRLEDANKDVQLPSAKDMKMTQLAGHGLHDSQSAMQVHRSSSAALRHTEDHVEGELRFAKDPLPMRVVSARDHKQSDDGIPSEFWSLNAKLSLLDPRAEVEARRSVNKSGGVAGRRAHSAMDAEARKRFHLSSNVLGTERRMDSRRASTPRGRDIVPHDEVAWSRENPNRVPMGRLASPCELKAQSLGHSLESPFAEGNRPRATSPSSGQGPSSRAAARETFPVESIRRRVDRNFSDILSSEQTAEGRSNQVQRSPHRADVLESALTGPFDKRNEMALRKQRCRRNTASEATPSRRADDNAGAIVSCSPRGAAPQPSLMTEEARRLRQEERAITHSGKFLSPHGEIARIQNENMAKRAGLGTLSPRAQASAMLPEQRKRQEMSSKCIRMGTGGREAPHDDGRRAPPLLDMSLPTRVRSASFTPRRGEAHNSARQSYIENVLATDEF